MVTTPEASGLNKWLTLVVILAVAIAASVCGLWYKLGAVALSSLWQPHEQLALDALLLQSTVLPRLLMAVLVGGILGSSSVLLQQLTRNPLAADNTLAVSSGAQMALLLVTLFFPKFIL